MSHLIQQLETQNNGLRQICRAHFFTKSFNIPRASRKTVDFWFSIFCTTLQCKKRFIERISAQVPMLSNSPRGNDRSKNLAQFARKIVTIPR